MLSPFLIDFWVICSLNSYWLRGPDGTDLVSMELNFWSSSVWCHRPSCLSLTSLVCQQYLHCKFSILEERQIFLMEVDSREFWEQEGRWKETWGEWVLQYNLLEGKNTSCSCWTHGRSVSEDDVRWVFIPYNTKQKSFIKRTSLQSQYLVKITWALPKYSTTVM